MNLGGLARRRGETADFSRSNYEVLFSVFMVGLGYLYRDSPFIEYPAIFYLFVSLLAANFVFNRVFSERSRVSLWQVDGMLLANIGIITAILSKSGGAQSYFWVLYLLPIFTGALTARIPEVAGAVLLSLCCLAAASGAAAFMDAAGIFAFAVKSGVCCFSAFVTYRGALSRRRLETEIGFKRFQVENLMAVASAREGRAQLDASAAEVGRMTASLLHDIGNVTTIILLTAEIMAKDEKPDQKDARRVVEAAKMVKSIIDGSLALIKGAKYDFRLASIGEPLRNAAAIFSRQARAKRVAVELEVEDGLPKLLISPPHIQRVAINAISNSISLFESGGKITLRASLCDGGVRVVIEDDGGGFPADFLAAGIRQFGTTRKESGGTGLGLFNSKEIVEKHGGTMAIRNREPSGAVVEFTLPLPPPA